MGVKNLWESQKSQSWKGNVSYQDIEGRRERMTVRNNNEIGNSLQDMIQKTAHSMF